MNGARGFWLYAVVVAAAAAPACSVVFSADDLSKGSVAGGGGGATGGASSHGSGGAGGQGGCRGDADCDDGIDCTRDTCHAGKCTHPADLGAPCGHGTDCTPPGTCNADAQCIPGDPDVTKCDDQNECTHDTCEVSGCRHTPTPGVGNCNDGNPCNDVGTCNAQGKCIAAAKPTQEVCINTGMPCPGNFYVSDYHCNTFCDSCPFCVNAITCTFACTPSFVACCNIGNGDCSAACPSGYQIQGGPVSAPSCGCGSGTGVTCVMP